MGRDATIFCHCRALHSNLNDLFANSNGLVQRGWYSPYFDHEALTDIERWYQEVLEKFANPDAVHQPVHPTIPPGLPNTEEQCPPATRAAAEPADPDGTDAPRSARVSEDDWPTPNDSLSEELRIAREKVPKD